MVWRLRARAFGGVLAVLTVTGAVVVIAAPRQEPAVRKATLQGEAIYPIASKAVWQQVTGLMTELKFPKELRDEQHQVLVTGWRRYDQKLLPTATELGLAYPDKPLRIQLHIAVAPHPEPARVAVGAVLEMERHQDGQTVSTLGYRPPVIDEWFLHLLDTKLGSQHVPLAATLGERRQQAKQLMPAGLADPCLDRVPLPSPGRIVGPVKVSEIQPVFPAQGFASGAHAVILTGMVTEHGTLPDLKVSQPSPGFDHYEQSARAAGTLWRFQPPQSDGCGIQTFLTLTINYKLR